MMQSTVSQALDEESIHYAGWRVAAAAFAGVMVSFAAIVPYTFSLFLDPLHQAFGWKREAMSGAFAVAAMTVALVSPLIGLLLDRSARPAAGDSSLCRIPGFAEWTGTVNRPPLPNLLSSGAGS
jgi:hypothetical protein